MADSVGNAFPRGINVGHVHVNNVDGFVYRYLGDVPTNSLNWVIIGGAADADPSTAGWTTRQDGAQWFNKALNAIRIWDGTQVVSIGTGSGGIGTQRWPYKFTGTELSTGFGTSGQADFIAPAAGTITKWCVIADLIGVEDAQMALRFDTFGAFALVDSVTIPGLTNSTIFERVVAQAVVEGDIVSVLHVNTLNPASHTVKINGYVDFTPD